MTPGPAGSVTAQSSCSDNGIKLTWSAGTGANTYNIYRAVHGGSPALLAGNIGNVLTYIDSGATTGTYYDYWVESKNTASGLLGSQTPAAGNSGSGVSQAACFTNPDPPTNPQSYNASGKTACNTVLLQWIDNSNNEDGFNLYRTSSSGWPTIGGHVSGNYIGATSTLTKLSTGTLYSLTYTPPDVNPYYYWVTAYASTSQYSIGESGPVAFAYNGGGSQSTVSDVSCSANLTGSDTDIIAVNAAPLSPFPQDCDQQSQPLPAYIAAKKTDVMTFSTNICNINGQVVISNLLVTNNLVNLQVPPASSGWNVCYSPTRGYNPTCTGTGAVRINQGTGSGTFAVAGFIPNQTLTVNLTGSSFNVATGTNAYITFDAQILPTGSTGRLFQDLVHIDFAGSAGIDAWTPLQQFLNGQVGPVLREHK